MASETTYTCDRCKGQMIGGNFDHFLEKVGVHVGKQYGGSPSFARSADWCRPCLIAMGLRKPADHIKDDPPAPDPVPTFEDVLREIVREEIESA